jgi:hypothetical protein
MHAKLWSAIVSKALVGWFIGNLVMAGFDDDDFVERLQNAWLDGGDNWAEKVMKVMDVNISPLAQAMGGSEDKETYLNIIGHFKDLFKWVLRPLAGEFFLTPRTKQSRPLALATSYVRGTDFWGKRVTTPEERQKLAKRGKPFLKTLTQKNDERHGPPRLDEMGSWIALNTFESLPIQAQTLWKGWEKDMELLQATLTMGPGLDVKAHDKRNRAWLNK